MNAVEGGGGGGGGGLNEQRVSLFSGKRTGMEWNGMEWKSTVIHENLFLCSYSV